MEDEATAYFEYANGATGVFVGSTGETPGVNRLDIAGDAGLLSYDGGGLTLIRNHPGTAAFNRETRDMFGRPETVEEDLTPAEKINQHALVIQNFVDAILDHSAVIAPAAEGLRSLALANAILWSSWEQAPVQMPLDSQAYQRALEARLAQSSLRRKADLEAHVDMEKSYR